MKKKGSTKKSPSRMRIPRPSYEANIDTLLYKVDKIEEGTGISMSKIEELNNRLYDPEAGVYSRMKKVETSIEPIPELKEAIATVDQRTVVMQEDIRLVKAWQERVSKVVKWSGVTLAGAVVTLLFKFIYDYLSGHVVIN